MNHVLNIYLVSLGCAKNLVDSEIIAGMIKKNGWRIVKEAALADVIIINTCGFIQSAKEETISYILEAARYKEEGKGKCRFLAVFGCMVEKYRDEMMASMPEIDIAIGTGRFQEIIDLIGDAIDSTKNSGVISGDPYLLRDLSTEYSAYLKIAEGCNNRCSYCLIPHMRGALKSRNIEDILFEAKLLLQKGVKEVIVIAQDITAYGLDIYGERNLPRLLDALAGLDFKWIRLLYAYPSHVDEALLQVMAKHQNICHYLDLPIQHINDRVLAAMKRHDTREIIEEKLGLIHKFIPDIALRTTMMVGFPGETDEEFRDSLEFLRQGYFDWVGAFAYSREEDTEAAELPGQVPAAVKEKRLDQTMSVLADVSRKKQQRYLGRVLEVLVEGKAEEEGYYLGRSMYQAPEVDGIIYIKAKKDLKTGDMIKVLIKRTDIYDLIGEAI